MSSTEESKSGGQECVVGSGEVLEVFKAWSVAKAPADVDGRTAARTVATIDGLVSKSLASRIDKSYAPECLALNEGLPDSSEDFMIMALGIVAEVAAAADAYVEKRAEVTARLGAELFEDLPPALDLDLLETIAWRNGSLRYMIVCCFLGDEMRAGTAGRLPKLREMLPQLASEALFWLVRLVGRRLDADASAAATRPAAAAVVTGGSEGVAELAGSAANEDSIRALLALGVYSSTHLLALIYAGDLTFWMATAEELNGGVVSEADLSPAVRHALAAILAAYPTSDHGVPDDVAGALGEPAGLARLFLSTFVHVVDNLIAGAGWDASAARDRLAALAVGSVSE
ncbi:uncharacterized protein AMSG_08125 [Thecamonas trahens ATCC 50062]|uniref:Uncharacterized protein n=1 Tax=Thecamonas trahens ATCC 50062 TaxID=461836 RepID=A0A0L0DMD8_THETB|nr:hypothetical protein AMSG_08125 [Thecamonas trahens ATCC 50062]KNC52558.1 hypothetical protein AMSG_08125 [Thecamonas trahens ATCC 50062]|eukprot:XP_013755348.1 hypothetical protein AMSG_08125 [Thecamonas trahens ATCC 50062]